MSKTKVHTLILSINWKFTNELKIRGSLWVKYLSIVLKYLLLVKVELEKRGLLPFFKCKHRTMFNHSNFLN